MANTIGTIELPGFEELIKKIQTFSDDLQKKIDREMEASCLTIVRNAKRKAPKNVGRLVQGITYVKHGLLNYEVISASNYSAYMEFGTKRLVQVPAGYEDFAAAFKGVSIDSGGLKARDAIYLWAKQKGIAKKWWYFIYKKIMIKGIKPHPFFIPALIEFQELEKRINNIISKAA
jgi:HK97 gp10 family phage protein